MLWHGRKFHFRVYALLRADMSAWLYRTAYILSASRPYSLGKNAGGGTGSATEPEGTPGSGFADELVHISNLAVNKHTAGHPGQVSRRLLLVVAWSVLCGKRAWCVLFRHSAYFQVLALHAFAQSRSKAGWLQKAIPPREGNGAVVQLPTP